MWRRFVYNNKNSEVPQTAMATKSTSHHRQKRPSHQETTTQTQDEPQTVDHQTKSEDVEERELLDRSKEKVYKEHCEAESRLLIKKPWFHGLMPREEIEPLLQQDGDFIVRQTDLKGGRVRLAISFKYNGQARHMIFCLNSDNQWMLRKDVSMESIEKLVTYYMTTKSEFRSDSGRLINAVPRPAWYILHDQISLKKKLGSGSFGDVFKAELVVDDKKIDVAVKTLRGKIGKKERSAFVKEASLNRRLTHPNIVRLLGIASQFEPIMVVLELAPGGCLKSHVKDNNHPPATLVKYLLDAAKGLEYLSTVGIIHRDVAARNCLLDANMTVKISDFGLSIVKDSKDTKQTRFPVKWLSPETLRSGTFSTKTDVWSYGIMMWEVFARCQLDPYPGLNNAEAKHFILEGKVMDAPKDTPAEAAGIMRVCWKNNPDERPTFAIIVQKLEAVSSALPKNRLFVV